MAKTRISGRYLAKRVLVSILIIWAIMTLLFALLKALPGDYASIITASPNLDQETLQNLKESYGLGEPLWKQYLKFLRNYLMLDFGYSVQKPRPVVDVIFTRLPRTLALFGTAFLLQYTIGVFAGIHFGWLRGSRTDKSGFTLGLTLYSIPFFWLAWILLLIFAYKGFGITWFPIANMTPAFKSVFGAFAFLGGVLKHMFLPLASLTIVGWGSAMLVTRTSMQEVLDEDYIETATAKGLSPATVKYKHAARNALIPVITQALVAVAFAIDGSVIVETVFSWPGIGLLLIQSITTRDFPVALAAFFMLGIIIVTMRLVTDIVYTYLDPRIKFGEQQ